MYTYFNTMMSFLKNPNYIPAVTFTIIILPLNQRSNIRANH